MKYNKTIDIILTIIVIVLLIVIGLKYDKEITQIENQCNDFIKERCSNLQIDSSFNLFNHTIEIEKFKYNGNITNPDRGI